MSGPITEIAQTNTNLGKSKIQGIDVDLKLRSEPTSIGRFLFNLTGTYYLQYDTQNLDGTYSDNISTVSELVGDSGGTSYLLTNAADAPRPARRFVNELRHQYTLGYTPATTFDGKYRRVKVEVQKRGYQIRHRGGYLALPSQSASPKPQAP